MITPVILLYSVNNLQGIGVFPFELQIFLLSITEVFFILTCDFVVHKDIIEPENLNFSSNLWPEQLRQY